MKRILFISIVTFLFIGCKGNEDKKQDNDATTKIKSKEKQLNISILLDLSERIKNPEAQMNDIENIKTITEFFRSNMESLGAYKAKGKIRIFFSPVPANNNINSTANKLIIDCSKMDNKGRKKVHDSITNLYSKNLNNIYKQSINSSSFPGSDIWRFFKDDIKDFCIEKDPNYRNILIILTDGYLFHEQSKFNNKNRFSYLIGRNLKPYRKQNFEELIEKKDFGIITERKDLNDLEVLVLEIKAENQSNKIDEDILRFLWEKWFKEMNISDNHYKVYPSNEPVYTKTRIENFLNQK
jgi:hypothetical protein